MVDTLKQPMGTQCIKLRANERIAAWQTANKKQSVGKQPQRCYRQQSAQDTQPRASAAGSNIEISARGIHFSTCPGRTETVHNTVHTLTGGGGEGGGGRQKSLYPYSNTVLQSESPMSSLWSQNWKPVLRSTAWSIANGKQHTQMRANNRISALQRQPMRSKHQATTNLNKLTSSSSFYRSCSFISFSDSFSPFSLFLHSLLSLFESSFSVCSRLLLPC
jgi:hypothetical protein